MQEPIVYQGRDLEAMSFAERYHRWILEVFKPYLGSRIVEVGAGAGSFSELLIETRPEKLTLVEPSKEMYLPLVKSVDEVARDGMEIITYNDLFRNVAEQIVRSGPTDSIIYVNVLEHIDDDVGELETVWRTLKPRGRVFIFVPAFQWLYGKFDERIGHVRRYTKGQLEEKCRLAGFRVIESRYFDLVGVLPWWLRYRLFKSADLDPWSVRLYDKFVVRFARVFEKLIQPPLGKNILIIGDKF